MYRVSDEHKTILVPPKVVYYDESFNCRDPFTEQSVLELAKDIDTHRLKIPLSVQPAADVIVGLPAGFEFRLIAGFRRFIALTKILNWAEIPVMVHEGLSEQEARRWNYKENVERKQLTFLEEARGLRRLYPPGTKPTKIAQDMHKTAGWVRSRLAILDMPAEIQEGVRIKRLTEYDIDKLARIPKDGQLDALRGLYAEQERAEHSRHVSFKTLEAKRKRGSREVETKIIQIASRVGDGLWCDTLRWQAGLISEQELDAAVDEQDRLMNSDLGD